MSGTKNLILGKPDEKPAVPANNNLETQPQTQPQTEQSTPVAIPGGVGPAVATPTTTQQGNQGTAPVNTPTPFANGGNAGSNAGFYDEFEQYIKSKYGPESDEDKAKREKKEKRDKLFSAIGDGISALSNLYFTTKGAPNAYDGKNTMSEATQKRIDKAKADRDANQKEYFNMAMQLQKAKEAKDNNDRSYKRQLERDAADDASRKQQQENWQRTFDRQGEQAEREHQFKVDQANQAQERWKQEFEYKQQQDKIANALRWAGINQSEDGKYTNFSVGDENIKVRTSDLNASNIAKAFGKIADSSKYKKPKLNSMGYPVTDANGQTIYETPSVEDMMKAIGENMNDENVAAEIRKWGKSTGKKKQQGNSNSNTPPSRRGSNTNNTPPSRR